MEINNFIVNSSVSIRDSVKKMDEYGKGFILTSDENGNITGIVTDGDFRRSVLNGIKLDIAVEEIANSNFKRVQHTYDESEVADFFNNFKINQIPVLENGKLVDILYRGDYPAKKVSRPTKKLSGVSAVIMAGGYGTRLAPFTYVLPKPLIPINETPIIHIIMDRLAEFGINNFHVSLNHKANMIKAYFKDTNHDFNIGYILEDKPLGTAGALKFLKEELKDTFFVTNCDIIIKSDYSDIYNFHKSGGYDFTLVASMQHHVVPYGVCEIEPGGELRTITEKPEYDFLVNTGMYVLEPSVLEFIPEGRLYHITHLIDDLKAAGKAVGVFPVSEKSWIDIGQWEEYRKAVKLLEG